MANNDNDESTPKSKLRKSTSRTLRILVVEPRGGYCRMVWCAIGIGISHLFIGATVMTVLLYFFSKGDLHTILCTVGFHLFSAQAILSLNYANGWSAPLMLRHRRFAHIMLQVCALVCAITGTAMVYLSEGLSGSVHSVTGLIAAILAVITFLIGPCAFVRGKYSILLHMIFGIPTFAFASISLCSGLVSSPFKEWTSLTVICILIGFIVFYTTFILVTCFLKCMMRI